MTSRNPAPSPRCASPLLAMLLIALALATGCAKAPLTGRSQMLLFPESEMLTLSVSQYGELINKSNVVTGTPEAEMIKSVGRRIAAATEEYLIARGQADRLEKFQWEFNLIDDPAVNAFCMPGGKVAFYTGILPICRDENGVAVVMGHEVGHALAQHGNERMSQAVLLGIGTVAATEIGRQRSNEEAVLYGSLFGIGSAVGVALPHSRKQEHEADEMGLVLMSLAGFDPRTAPPFWERMAAQSGGSNVPGFLSTHPVSEARAKRLAELMPDAITVHETGVLPVRWTLAPHRQPAWLQPVEVAWLDEHEPGGACCR